MATIYVRWLTCLVAEFHCACFYKPSISVLHTIARYLFKSIENCWEQSDKWSEILERIFPLHWNAFGCIVYYKASLGCLQHRNCCWITIASGNIAKCASRPVWEASNGNWHSLTCRATKPDLLNFTLSFVPDVRELQPCLNLLPLVSCIVSWIPL